MKTWKWAIVTAQGIYNGELIGMLEPDETNEHAMQNVSTLARNHLQSTHNVHILACLVSDSDLLIDAPTAFLTPIDIEVTFKQPPPEDTTF